MGRAGRGAERGAAGRGARAVLGLGAGAGAREAAAAYRGLMRRVHPDVPGGDAAAAAEVNLAYEAVLAELAGRPGAGAGARGEGVEGDEDELSWSGASLDGGDPCELWRSPWDGEEQWVTAGQAQELREYARRGWALEAAVMLREFRWRNDRWRP